ncbi:caspase family protein [Flavobacterium jejuense]|uniref:Caspase family protein n=1 Tax=Flavobacterium jejuense TaxID=1544455 RepID=A0ABX0IUM7_9FLAO|nr:caspase family protein [Flavobacterium jejuense]NHN25485.1 caspase family protein [Flavobacterium jejuense]
MAKKAVIIGINDYAPIGPGGPDLNGCVHDARDMANTLVICGFEAKDIRILTNQNATRDNIISYLKWLVTTSKKGDSLVFYYSGHGTRVASMNDDLELDGLDEAICPHDFKTAGVLKDDDLKAVLNTLPKGVNLDVFFDCCHSGSGTRRIKFDEFNNLTNETPRFIEPMLEDEFYFNFSREIQTNSEKEIETKEDKKSTMKSLVKVRGMNHVLWAACKENQVAMEGDFSGQTRGYFTYNLCKVLRATNGKINRSLLDIQLSNALTAMGAAQINQTEGKTTELKQFLFN